MLRLRARPKIIRGLCTGVHVRHAECVPVECVHVQVFARVGVCVCVCVCVIVGVREEIVCVAQVSLKGFVSFSRSLFLWLSISVSIRV